MKAPRTRKSQSPLLVPILVVGLFALDPSTATAAEDSTQVLPKKIILQPASECSSCTRRHQALAKAKKLREKKRLEEEARKKEAPSE